MLKSNSYERLLAVLLWLGPMSAELNAEIIFPVELEFRNSSLQLCGEAEVKAYKFFRVAYSGFYREDCQRPWNIADTAEARYMQFNYTREVPAHAFRESAEVLLRRNQDFPQDVWNEIQQFHEGYRSVKDGDEYVVYYQPDEGLTLWLNGELLANTENKSWASVYFSIWLGADPFSSSLKAALLGQ